MAGSKTYTREACHEAWEAGKEMYALDTGNDGDDDTLIGSYDACLHDVLSYHEIERLPEHWSLERITWEV